MDTLALRGMKFHAFHGVHAREKQEGNHFEVDVILKTNLSKAAKSDDLSDTPDYSLIEEAARSVMNGPSADLIEHLALNIGNRILESLNNFEEMEVCIRKLNPPLETETHCSEVRMKWPRS